MILHASKDGNPDSLLKHLCFKNVEDMIVFQGFPEVAIHHVIFVEKPKSKIISFLGINIDILFYLIRQRFQAYRCESGIAIFAWRVPWNYAYSPFNTTVLGCEFCSSFKPTVFNLLEKRKEQVNIFIFVLRKLNVKIIFFWVFAINIYCNP